MKVNGSADGAAELAQCVPCSPAVSMLLLCSCIALASAIALLYALFDVNYFIRIAFTIGYARLFQKKIKVLDSSRIYGKQRCLVLIGRDERNRSRLQPSKKETPSVTE
jgi:hypothetical protein